MKTYYLAIDIGASSGRHILGWLDGGKICLEEAYRFPNQLVEKNGRMCWDTPYLFGQVVQGMKVCAERGMAPRSVAVDTWGVDFCLLDESGKRMDDCVGYRDARTDGMDRVLSRFIDEEALYGRTGIQKQPFNTIYQLLAIGQQQPGLLERAQSMLMVPEYLAYLLTGVQGHEYTNASTTGLLDAAARDWDYALIDMLGLPRRLFGPLAQPGTLLGRLAPAVAELAGFDCDVVWCGTHDTASAVIGSPIDVDSLFLSSGTWSLLGAETDAPVCKPQSREHNLTNEGGHGGKYRYLKNIMGLWMIQRIRSEMEDKHTFAEMAALAEENEGFPSRVDVDDLRFLAPPDMGAAVRAYCAETGQQPPRTDGEMIYCVYQSLADSYAKAVRQIEALTDRTYGRLCIVGGGSNNGYLNRLAARTCGKAVTAGPAEATAIGNLMMQMIHDGGIASVEAGRALIRASFDITEYNV